MRPLELGNQRLQFQDRWADELWYEPQEVSDGSMLVLAYSILAYQQPVPDVIG